MTKNILVHENLNLSINYAFNTILINFRIIFNWVFVQFSQSIFHRNFLCANGTHANGTTKYLMDKVNDGDKVCIDCKFFVIYKIKPFKFLICTTRISHVHLFIIGALRREN